MINPSQSRSSGVGRWVSGVIISVLILLTAMYVWLQADSVVGIVLLVVGIFGISYSLYSLVSTSTVSYSDTDRSASGMLQRNQNLQRGPSVVAIGGGTGLPAALRALKHKTHNITAVVTVADDGGSSGRLRREMGVLPPGDLRNNIVALADDESLMAKLFQFRFQEGELKGHSFGNLFIGALSSITEGGLETALIETARVLNIQGTVLPSTLQDVNLRAQVRLPGKNRSVTILGEAAIGDAGGKIEHLEIIPPDAEGYAGSVDSILRAEFIVIGPGSLYTSIIPNLLVPDIASALRATPAYIVYICNVATQPGETDNYTVAEHVMAIEDLIGRGVFQAVIANNAYPIPPADSKTEYVQRVPTNHQILQRYEIFYTDLTDNKRPWRHDPQKLGDALIELYELESKGKKSTLLVTL